MPSPFKMLTHTQRLLGMTYRLNAAVKSQQLLTEDFANLRALRKVVADHGLNRSLVSYAGFGRHLSQLLPALPAVETLNSVPIPKRDPRHTGSLEAIDAVLNGEATPFMDWLKSLADDVAGLLDSAEDVGDDTREAVSDMMEAMADKVITDDMLNTTVVTARTADGFCAIFTVVAERVKQIGAVDVDAFFTSPEYRENCASIIKTMVEEFKPLMGACVGEDDCVYKDEDAVDDEYLPREASLIDLGFTSAGMQMVLEKITAVLEALQVLTTRKDAIVGSLTQLADRVGTPDASYQYEIPEAQTLISNYIGVITLLVRDGFHHIHEALDVISDVVDAADARSDDGRSD